MHSIELEPSGHGSLRRPPSTSAGLAWNESLHSERRKTQSRGQAHVTRAPRPQAARSDDAQDGDDARDTRSSLLRSAYTRAVHLPRYDLKISQSKACVIFHVTRPSSRGDIGDADDAFQSRDDQDVTSRHFEVNELALRGSKVQPTFDRLVMYAQRLSSFFHCFCSF
jgi:hypothetical protein